MAFFDSLPLAVSPALPLADNLLCDEFSFGCDVQTACFNLESNMVLGSELQKETPLGVCMLERAAGEFAALVVARI